MADATHNVIAMHINKFDDCHSEKARTRENEYCTVTIVRECGTTTLDVVALVHISIEVAVESNPCLRHVLIYLLVQVLLGYFQRRSESASAPTEPSVESEQKSLL